MLLLQVYSLKMALIVHSLHEKTRSDFEVHFNWPCKVSYLFPCRYLVMSTGAHWKKYSMTSYRGMVDNVISYLDLKFQGKRAYIRSSIPEHPGCAGKQVSVLLCIVTIKLALLQCIIKF